MTQLRMRTMFPMVVALIVTVVAGCAAPTASAPAPPGAGTGPTGPAAPPAPGEVRVTGAVRKPAAVTLAQLTGMPSQTVSVEFGSSKGTERHTEVGVALVTVVDQLELATVAGKKNDQLSFAILAVGADGYQALISYGEIAPHAGNRGVLLATVEDGQPLARPRLVVPGDVKGSRYVTDVVGLHVVRLDPESAVTSPLGRSADLSVDTDMIRWANRICCALMAVTSRTVPCWSGEAGSRWAWTETVHDPTKERRMMLAVDEPRIKEVVGSLNRKMLINGEWVDSASGKTFDSVNPATEEVLASVAHGEAEDADRAVRPPARRSRRVRRGARCRMASAERSSTSWAT